MTWQESKVWQLCSCPVTMHAIASSNTNASANISRPRGAREAQPPVYRIALIFLGCREIISAKIPTLRTPKWNRFHDDMCIRVTNITMRINSVIYEISWFAVDVFCFCFVFILIFVFLFCFLSLDNVGVIYSVHYLTLPTPAFFV